MRTSQGMVNEDADRARFKLSLFPFFLFFCSLPCACSLVPFSMQVDLTPFQNKL